MREKTGLVIDAYFSGTKIRWILDHITNGQKRAEKGELLFGTVDSWIIWNLTGGKVHVTDYSNAARTMLFNIHTLQWDKELLAMLNIPAAILPEVLPSSYVYGETITNIFGSKNTDMRDSRRPAGSAVRAGVLRCGQREEYVRYGLFYFNEYGQPAGDFTERAADNNRLGN